MNKKGFTLIEMLVVIAIIAVLVAIIIPTVSSATVKAAAATNAANLRSYKAELTTTYLSDPDSVEIADDGTVTFAGTTFEYKNVSDTLDPDSETLTASYDEDTNSFTVYFGVATYDINYFSTIAETGKAPENS